MIEKIVSLKDQVNTSLRNEFISKQKKNEILVHGAKQPQNQSKMYQRQL